MRVSTLVAALSAPLLALAAPVKRETTVGPNDVLVFQFAHVLEQLETQFYMQALQKFQEQDFLTAGYSSANVIIEQIQSIAFDEMSHTIALEAAIKALGADPIQTCQFDFSSVLTDVATMATVARLVEHVGVGAYLGAAHLLSDGRLVTSAATILTIEARHSSILNVMNGGVAIPQAFDIPLSPSQVLGIAGPFISGCDLGVPANAPLKITTTGNIGPGVALAFDSPALQGLDTSSLFCNMVVGGARDAISLPFNQCIVPQGVVGPVAISILNDSQPLLASDIIDQAAGTTVAGPLLAFIDFGVQQQQISQLVLSPNSPLNKDLTGSSVGSGSSAGSGAVNSAGSTDTVSTISPDEASSIAASATASGGDPLATDSAGGLATIDSTTPTDGAINAAPAPTSTASGTVDDPIEVGAVGAAPAASADPAASTDNTGVAAVDAGTVDASGVAPVDPGAETNAAVAIPAQFNAGPPQPSGTPSADGTIVVLGWDSPSSRR